MTPPTPQTPQTPSSSVMSDVDSLESNETGTTPDFTNLKLGRGRGRPRKELTVPTLDDFPYDGTDEEKKRYINKKNTEMWRFKQLSTSGSSEYRASENARVKAYYKDKKKKTKATEQQKKKSVQKLVEDSKDDDQEDRKKQQSRAR